MAYWGNKVSYSLAPQETIAIGDGINTYNNPFNIKKSECVSALNISNQNYPALSVREGRTYEFASSSAPISTVNGIGQRNGTLLQVVDGTSWKQWNSTGQAFVSLTTVISGATKIVEFNTETTRYSILANTSDIKYYNGSTTASITDAPKTPYYTVDDYRLYALKDSVLSCSAAGSITDWTTVDDSDSIAITGMIGAGTAVIAYNDMVIAFSDQTMHILYGNDPFDFQLMDPIQTGCVSDKSVIVHDGILYFMDYYQFKAFTGGLPVDVSQKVKGYLADVNYTYKDKICSGSLDKNILISIPYGSTATTNNLTLQYDTERKNWYVWNIGFLGFSKIGELLYGIDTSGYIWKLFTGTDDDGTAISWEVEFGVWDGTPVGQRKVISEIWAVLDLPTNSTLTLSYSATVDNDDWATLYTFTADSDEQNTRVKIPTSVLQGITWYRLKLSGTGSAVIHYIEPYIRVKRR